MLAKEASAGHRSEALLQIIEPLKESTDSRHLRLRRNLQKKVLSSSKSSKAPKNSRSPKNSKSPKRSKSKKSKSQKESKSPKNSPKESKSPQTKSSKSPKRSKNSSKSKTNELPPQASYGWNDGRDYPVASDFGDPCETDSDCISGICGTSCSTYDANPFTGTSCVCPCTNKTKKTGGKGKFVQGPCCCGCVENGGTTIGNDVPVAQECPQHTVKTPSNPSGSGWARNESTFEPPLNSIPCDFTYARFNKLNIANDDIVIPKGVEYKVDWTGPSTSGTKEWGEPCDDADECASGMCGTGCDCPSRAFATCSCNTPCNFPAKCCGGGCNLNQNPVVKTCPVLDYEKIGAQNGVDFDEVQCDGDNCYFKNRITYTTFDGPTPWYPDEAHNSKPQDATFSLCLLYKYTMAGVEIPEICDQLLSRGPPFQTNITVADVDKALCRSNGGQQKQQKSSKKRFVHPGALIQ